MHKYALPLTAIHISGATNLIKSLDALTRDCFATHYYITEPRYAFVEALGYADEVGTVRRHVSDWIVRDNEGRIVDPADIPQITYYHRRNIDKAAKHAMANGLPMPLGLSGSRIPYRRNPKVRGEESSNRKLRQIAGEHGFDLDRLGRRRKLAAGPYDDADLRHHQRSWKTHRQTQWKEQRP